MGSTKITAGNRHRHYEMIVAKAANMELVVFQVDPNGKNKAWSEYYCEEDGDFPMFYKNCNYFLCLPQHKEACLHWLNGSDLIQDSQYVDGKYSDVEASLNPSFDTHGDLFMTTERNIRIKPEKEKRWILVNAIDNFQPRMFDDEGDANHMLQGSHPNWSKHEIEVEVAG